MLHVCAKRTAITWKVSLSWNQSSYCVRNQETRFAATQFWRSAPAEMPAKHSRLLFAFGWKKLVASLRRVLGKQIMPSRHILKQCMDTGVHGSGLLYRAFKRREQRYFVLVCKIWKNKRQCKTRPFSALTRRRNQLKNISCSFFADIFLSVVHSGLHNKKQAVRRKWVVKLRLRIAACTSSDLSVSILILLFLRNVQGYIWQDWRVFYWYTCILGAFAACSRHETRSPKDVSHIEGEIRVIKRF